VLIGEIFVGFAYIVASGVEEGQHRPYKAFLMSVFFYINDTMFVRDMFCGWYVREAVKRTKFCDINYEIFPRVR